jgi:hypothetical protein
MENDRRLRILSQLVGHDDSSVDRLSDICMNLTGMNGVGIMLRSVDTFLGSVGMTDAVSALIEELQFTLGEGPCIDAFNLEGPILEPDLAEPSRRWLGFTPPVLDTGVRAIFSFPLQAGSVCIGALDLYRRQPGALSEDQHADALAIAGLVAEVVLAMQAQARPGRLAAELTRLTEHRLVEHQAVGMASVQLGLSIGDALLWLRAHAFAHDIPFATLSQDLVERRVTFNPGRPT